MLACAVVYGNKSKGTISNHLEPSKPHREVPPRIFDFEQPSTKYGEEVPNSM